MKAIIQRIRTAAMFAVLFVLGLASTAWAATDKTNPVTGENQSYTYNYIGSGAWTASDWSPTPSKVPQASGSAVWDSLLIDGNLAVTAPSHVEGWAFRIGLFGEAKLTVPYIRYWNGAAAYAVVDEGSKLTIQSINTQNNWNATVNYYVAAAGGVTYECAFNPTVTAAAIYNYNLKGAGSVVYENAVSSGSHVIKMVDATLSGTSRVASKTLVSFASSTKTFTADAAIKVYDTDGTTLKKLVGVTAVRKSGATIANTVSQLTTANAVGSCEIVQCTNGIVLYYVDGAPSAVTGYTPSININFTHNGGNLTTSADVGLAPYAVPGTVWNNYAVPDNGATITQTSVYSVDATGVKSLVSGSTVSISGTRGSYTCNTLTAASDLRHGYIDEKVAEGQNTPTVVVSGIPFDHYTVVVYTAADTENATFNYITVNGTDYTYVNEKLATGTSAWGNAGAANSANALQEGMNVLVSPVTSGSTATIVGHKASNTCRGNIAAVQIVEIGENDLVIELDGDKTHTFEEAKTYDTVYVTGSGTLTFAGTASTATTLDIFGSAAVNMVGSSLTPTTVTGNGTVVYDGEVPPADKGWTDSANWTGTVWIKDFGSLSTSGRADASLTADMPNWGNSGSKVKFTNIQAYSHNQNLTCSYTLVLEDGTGANEYAWRCDNGYQNNTLTVARLSGSGTFYDHSGPAATFTFNSFDGFTGKFDIASSGHQIKVPAGATLTVAQNSSIKFTSQGMLGTLNIAKGKTFTAASDDAVSYNTGSSTVNVYGTLNFDTFRWTIGPDTVINLYEDAIVQGTGDSDNNYAALDFNVPNGSTIHAQGNATISCVIRNNYANGTAKINVDAGKTLTFSGNLMGGYGFKKLGAGVLKLTGAVAKFPTIDAGTVLLGGNKTWDLGTLRDFTGYMLEAGSTIAITQTQAEYGTGEMSITGIDSSINQITVNKYDGTTASLIPAAGQATLVEDPVVSGKACWYDFTFTNTLATAVGSVSTLTLTDDHTSSSTSEYGDLEDARSNTYRGVKSYRRPYGSINLGSKSQFTVATYATMPSRANTVLMAFGGTYANNTALILASGADGDKAVLYYYVKSSNTLTELKTMPAIGSRTVPHLYVFQKVSDHQINIYLDGKLSLAYLNNDITFSVSSGFQMAAVYGGTPNGVSRLENSSDASAIAMTRIYDRILSAKEIEALKEAWPYYSPNGNSERELATDETAPDWNEDGKWDVDGASANAAKAKSVVVIANGAGASAAVAVNLAANTAYESLTVSGEDAVSFALKGGYTGKIVPAAASIETDTTLAVNAVDLAQGPVEVADGKTLTFDVTSLINDTANSLAPVQLSGVATLGAGAAIAVTPTTSTLWNITATPDDGGNYWVNFNPKRANTSIYWKSTNSGDWTGVNDANHIFTTEAGGETTTPFYFGDTVVIRDDVQLWLKDSAAGISFSIENNATVKFSRSDDGATYAMKGQTVAIAAGATAQPERYANNGWDAGNPTIYGVTFTGYGNVKVVNGETLTLSGGSVISAPLTGSGTVNLESTSSMTVAPGASWTGTVVLPAITSNVNLTLYGNSDSTIGITSLNTYLTSPYTEIDSTLRLDGAITITAFSNRDYSFTKITGNGDLTFPNSSSPTSIAITELANYTGTLINNHESVGVAVTRVTKSVDIDGGALLLATNGVGEVSVSSFEVAGVAVSHYAAAGGFYRGAARYDGTVYKTFAEAIAAAELAGDTYEDVTILDPTATCPDGYYIDTENNNSLAMYQAAIVQNNNGAMTTNFFKTAQLAVDAIEANVQAYQKYTHFEVYSGTEAAMSINLSATVWSQLYKTVKVKCLDGATVVVTTASDEYTLSASAADEDGIVTYAKTAKAARYVWVATLQSDWYRPTNWKVGSAEGATASRAPGSTDTVVFSDGASVSGVSGISVAELQVSGTVTLSGGGTLTSASAITLGANDTLSLTGVTLSPTPTSGVDGYTVVEATNNGTTTYSLTEQIMVDDAEVGYMDNATAVITNTTAAVTVPASATAVALAFSTGSEITLTSTTTLTTDNVTVYATDANGHKASTDISSAFKVTAGENNTYTISLDGSATVNDVKVQPTIGESATVTVGEEEVPATALSDSGAPSFAIKTIPGLWYAVEESTDANTFTAGAPVKATSAGTRLSADAPSSGVKYYKIAVGASKAALQ